MARKKRRITAEDLYRIQLVLDPQVSPDGRHVIFCVQRVDQQTNKQYKNLWLVPAGGGRTRQFTYGDQNDSHPRWSPDGEQIAFISDRGDEKNPQIYLISSHGGESRPLTDMKGRFDTVEWSPDGRRLLCTFRKKDAEAIEREENEEKGRLGVVSRRVTRAEYKLDGVGYLSSEKWHVWTIDVDSGRGTQLTNGDEYNEVQPCWSPDGQAIAFMSNRSERPDVDRHLVDLFVISAEGDDMRRVPTPVGPKMLPSFSPDGGQIAYLGKEGKGNAWQNLSLWLAAADGSSPAENLTGQYDIHVSNGTLTDTGDRPTLPPVWSADGKQLYFHVTRHGNVDLCTIDRNGNDLQTLVTDGTLGVFSFDRVREKAAYFHGSFNQLGQVNAFDVKTHRSRQLTHFNEAWLRHVDVGTLEEVWFTGRDGNDLQGWILKPPEFDESIQYPSILEIHGGPLAQYGDSFMHEFYFLAAHDYVVYFCNPRGGQGYGEAHSRAIHRNWGDADYADLMSWTDYLAQQPYIDAQRMGVTGGSYGGYMTSWIIGQTDRFKAAVAQRIVSNLISFWGSSDMGYYFEDAWSSQGKPPWEDLEKYWDQSPMKYVGRVKTPTLVIHSEQDLRCRQEQGEQLFLALRKLGVDTELILFPESPHGLSRMGRTDRRIDRLNHILRWFETYLK